MGPCSCRAAQLYCSCTTHMRRPAAVIGTAADHQPVRGRDLRKRLRRTKALQREGADLRQHLGVF